MKLSQLFVAFLFSVTVWADRHKRLVFFAKVNDTLTPLTGQYLGGDFENSSVLSYGNSSADPVSFELTQEKMASTNDELDYLGFRENGLVFGRYVKSFQLNVTDGRVYNDPFYSCQDPKSQTHEINQGRLNRPRKGCFRVRIFLLPYDKKNKTAVIGTPAPPGLSVRSELSNAEYYEKYPDLPWVLFANVSGTLEPLSGDYIKANRYVFSYGNSSATPAEIFLADGNYVYVRTSTLYNVFFKDSRLLFGPTVKETSLVLDARMRAQNSKFYSCPTKNSLNEITNSMVDESCFEVEVYLLHYNKTSGYPILPEEKRVISVAESI